jgi:hypothetical protein
MKREDELIKKWIDGFVDETSYFTNLTNGINNLKIL